MSEMAPSSVTSTTVANVPRRGNETTRWSVSSRFTASRTGVRPMPSSAARPMSLMGSPGRMSSMINRSLIRWYARFASEVVVPRSSSVA